MDTFAPPDPLAHRFVWELMKTGLVLTDSLSSLIDSFAGEDPWPDRETGEVLIEAAAGSIAPALRGVAEDDVDMATDLIVAVRDRFMGDLRLAAEMSGRRENGHRLDGEQGT
jgi:hypothetical protein